jgi:cytidylate kinase
VAGLTVTIDGPAGAGKSSVARRLARCLGYVHLDTGAMYRALTLAALERGVGEEDGPALARLAEEVQIGLRPGGTVCLDRQDVTARIRSPEVDRRVSRVAAHPQVRQVMLRRQQELAQAGEVVIEGRDAGTAIAPQAEVKVFLTASLPERARRRARELAGRGEAVDLPRLEAEMARRDQEDSAREADPLRPAADAVFLDTTELSEDEVVRRLERLVRARQERARVPR